MKFYLFNATLSAMYTHNIKPSLLPFCLLPLIGCGGDSGDIPEEVNAMPPTLNVTMDNTAVDEGGSVKITHAAKDYLGNSISSKLSCDIGSLNGNEFTAPIVASDTTATCSVTATDSGNRSSSESLSIQIKNLAPAIALSDSTVAVAAKLTSFDISFAALPAGYIDAKINNESIKLGVTDSNNLVYFPPVNASGQQTLELNIDGETISYIFDVTPITDVIADPLTYVTDYFTTLTTSINNKLNAPVTNLTTAEIQAMNNIKSFFDTANYNDLNNDELTFLAYILRDNQQQIDIDETLRKASYQTTSGAAMSATSFADLSACEKVAIIVVASAAATTKLIAASGALAVSGVGTSVSLGMLAVGGATLGLTFTGIDLFKEKCYGPVDAWIDELNNINTKGIFLNKSSISAAAATNTDEISLVFNDSKVKQFHLKQQYSLLNGAESFMTNVNSAFTALKSMLHKTIDLLAQFSPAVLSDLVNLMKSYGSEYSEVLDASKVSLANFNGSNISHNLFMASDNQQTFSLVFDFIDETKIPASGNADFTFAIENTLDYITIPVKAKLYNSDVPEIAFIWNGKELGVDTPALEAVVEITPGKITTQASFQLLNKGERAIKLSKVSNSTPSFTLSNLNSATLVKDQQIGVTLQYTLQPNNRSTTQLTFGQTEFSDFDRSFSVNAIINYTGGYEVEVVESSSVEDCARDPHISTYGLTKVDYETYTLPMSNNHTATFRAEGSSINASGSHTFEEDEGITTENYSILVNYKGEVSGSSSWGWVSNNSGLTCNGSSSFKGVKQ